MSLLLTIPSPPALGCCPSDNAGPPRVPPPPAPPGGAAALGSAFWILSPLRKPPCQADAAPVVSLQDRSGSRRPRQPGERPPPVPLPSPCSCVLAAGLRETPDSKPEAPRVVLTHLGRRCWAVFQEAGHSCGLLLPARSLMPGVPSRGHPLAASSLPLSAGAAVGLRSGRRTHPGRREVDAAPVLARSRSSPRAPEASAGHGLPECPLCHGYSSHALTPFWPWTSTAAPCPSSPPTALPPAQVAPAGIQPALAWESSVSRWVSCRLLTRGPASGDLFLPGVPGLLWSPSLPRTG